MTIQPIVAPRLNGTATPFNLTFILDGPNATVVIDPVGREVYIDSVRTGLTRREFDLLVHLARHPGVAFNRLQLLRQVWGHEFSGQRTIDVHIRRLRAKLGDHGAQITTLHGYGYRLEPGGRFTVLPEPT